MKKTIANRAAEGIVLLKTRHPLTREQDLALANACLEVLEEYRTVATTGSPSALLTRRARRAYLHLGGDPRRTTTSLKDYDHIRYGPFLGVSDEGSAAANIRDAALESPKVRALPRSVVCNPLLVGLAVDAERLGGIGEVAVGPEEYAAVWLACVDRVLITTNVGTRVNMRVYRREPRVLIRGSGRDAIERAKTEITAAFKPFVETPDNQPRPLTVFVDIPPDVQMTTTRKKTVLTELAAFVATGEAAGKRQTPLGHALGLAISVGSGISGKSAAMDAIDLASSAGLGVVVVEGVKRKAADEAISLAGLLDYFAPGIVAPLLRKAKEKGITLRAANLPDTDTIARSIWVDLTTARSMGTNLGKYGCFPLTCAEIDHVVEQVQKWLPNWSAAPVFFVDQGLLREGSVDVGNDLPRGIEVWLDTIAKHGVRLVLIDTIDKVSGRRLLKKSSKDDMGYLGPRQIERIENYAGGLGIKVLWAGGLGLRDAFAMGKLGVFGIYITSAAATTVPVFGSYVRDPALAGVKEPSKEAVLRTKILLEAGFLVSKLPGANREEIDELGSQLLCSLDSSDAVGIRRATAALATACEDGWRTYWKRLVHNSAFM